ncbi:MAG TPA: segregation/condensation protein A [Anaerolineae bacterium]|nr:segregation/condensation protein A [Anaerolineae bacterium]
MTTLTEVVLASSQPEYAVRLESFEGPLDLLLRLIEKAELDITTISLAQVADQYLAYMRQLEEIHPDLLADFLVVAAKLILIKSRALLPRPPQPDEEEDVGDDLVRQLEEYRRFKHASQHLRQREEQGMRSYVRLAPPPAQPRGLTPGEVSLADLLAAFERVLADTPTVPVSTVVAPVVISIDDKMRAIRSALASSRRVHFTGLLMRAQSRVEVVVTFLAILELIKLGHILAEQDAPFGEIYIVDAPPPEPASEA